MRFAPEIAAGITYLTAVSVTVPGSDSGSSPSLGLLLMVGLAVGGLLTFAAAITSASRALARERERGTLEALLLASVNRETLIRGRFWCVTVPWLRLFAYLLPLYLILTATDLLKAGASGPDALICSAFSAFSSRFNLLFLLMVNRVGLAWDNVRIWGGFLVLIRWLNHVSVFLFAAAASYWISARARSATAALLISAIVVPVALASFLALHELLVGAFLLDIILWQDWMVWLYALLAAICIAARILLTGYLLRRTTRDLVARDA